MPPEKSTLQHLSPVLGLDANDVKEFEVLKAKSNREQKVAMMKELNLELKRYDSHVKAQQP